MFTSLTDTEKLLPLVISVPVIFCLMIVLGRFLKRSAGVRLGAMYRLFSVVFSIYLPMKVLGMDFQRGIFDVRRELRALTIVLGSFFFIALLERYLWEGYFRRRRRTEIPAFVHQLVAVGIVVVAFMMVLSGVYNEAKALAGIMAGSGLVAIILGFAMQDMLGNIISGIALEIGKPFKPGHWLIYENYRAEVIEVNWRSTRLRTTDDVYLDIPNNQLVKHNVVNLSFPNRQHAERILVGVDYNVAPNLVREVLLRAATNAFSVLPKPAPKVFLKEFGESAVMYEIKFWFERDDLYSDIMDSVRTNVWYELNRNNIKIPYPMRTIEIERKTLRTQNVAPTIMSALRNQKFFQCLNDTETDRLLSSAKLQRYGRGEKLIRQGTEANSMYVLVNGTVDVHVNHEGKHTHVATLRAGDYFGEMSLLTGEARSATVVAGSDCESLKIDKESFAEVLQSNPELMQRLSEMLAQRRMETEGIIASATEKETIATKEEYAANFLAKLYSFFQL